MAKENSKEIIVIVGPTASGKSDYAIRLAHEIGGEIISADSRQVYRGMDIGTGKVTRDPVAGHPELVEVSTAVQAIASHPELVEGSQLKEERENKANSSTRRLALDDTFVSSGIRHYLLDVASPRRSYNVTHFLRDAKVAIADIRKRSKVPIICGGTNFWIETLVFGTEFPEVKPNTELRKRLGKMSVEALFQMLEVKDPNRAGTIDPHNKIRLIRALEIVSALGSVPDPSRKSKAESRKSDEFRFIGIDIPREQLRENIEIRLEKRLKKGMLEEVKNLRNSGISWKRLESFGLEYRWITRFLQGTISEEEMREKLATDIYHYAKRQMTFLRRLERRGIEIEWVK